MSALMKAIKGGHLVVFQLPLERGADLGIFEKVS